MPLGIKDKSAVLVSTILLITLLEELSVTSTLNSFTGKSVGASQDSIGLPIDDALVSVKATLDGALTAFAFGIFNGSVVGSCVGTSHV